jgi:hypothetical protein
MRPKYSSPGAELLYSWHCRCCHLLFVEPQGSALFDADGAVFDAAGDADVAPFDAAGDAEGALFDGALFDGDALADGFGVGAAACAEGMVLAIASAASGTSTMRFTCECSPWERPARSDVRALGDIRFPLMRRAPSGSAKERARVVRERARR